MQYLDIINNIKTENCMIDYISNSLNLTPISEDIYSNYPEPDKNEYNRQDGKFNAHYGKTHSEESKRIMSEKAKNRISNRIGKLHSEESKEKIRKKAKGRPSARKGKDPWNKGLETDQLTKQKISEANTGKKRSQDFKNLISEKAKNRTPIICEHCEKSVSPGNYSRWHGNKCKNK